MCATEKSRLENMWAPPVYKTVHFLETTEHISMKIGTNDFEYEENTSLLFKIKKPIKFVFSENNLFPVILVTLTVPS